MREPDAGPNDPAWLGNKWLWCDHHSSVHGRTTTPYPSQLEECELGINPCNMRGCMCSDEVDECNKEHWHDLYIFPEDEID